MDDSTEVSDNNGANSRGDRPGLPSRVAENPASLRSARRSVGETDNGNGNETSNNIPNSAGTRARLSVAFSLPSLPPTQGEPTANNNNKRRRQSNDDDDNSAAFGDNNEHDMKDDGRFECWSFDRQERYIESICNKMRENPRAYFDLPFQFMGHPDVVGSALSAMRRIRATLRDDTSVPSKRFVESMRDRDKLLRDYRVFRDAISRNDTTLSFLNKDVLSTVGEFLAGVHIDYLQATTPVVDFLHRHCIWDDYSLCWENRAKAGMPMAVQPMDVVFGGSSNRDRDDPPSRPRQPAVASAAAAVVSQRPSEQVPSVPRQPGNVLFERLVCFFQGLFHAVDLTLRPVFTRHLVSVMAHECQTLFFRSPRGTFVLPRTAATMKVVEHMMESRTKPHRRQIALEAYQDPVCRRIIARTLQLTVPERADRVLLRLVHSIRTKKKKKRKRGMANEAESTSTVCSSNSSTCSGSTAGRSCGSASSDTTKKTRTTAGG